MKALFIGGTGTISTEISKLAAKSGVELYLLNRGKSNARLKSLDAEISAVGGSPINYIQADISDKADVAEKLKAHNFDVVANFIVFTPEQARRDLELFSGITKQYIFISSASAYQKPLASYLITESTPLVNPYWAYSRDKIACEEIFINANRESGFPITIVRPSHTYDERSIPLAIHGDKGSWQVLKRIMEDKPVIVHGDGSSLWTLTHSRDFAKAFCGLMGNIHAIGEAVHITSDESLTWNQIYHCLGNCVGKEPVIRHISSDFLVKCNPELEGGLLGDKSNSVVFDNTKIKRLVPDFTATTRFDQGARESVAYFTANKDMQIPDPEFDEWTEKVIKAYDSMAI
ncbi:MAG: NAD-dependent epimerase/dehydratase family protein [Oscillospiraceae bacterium]|nr:NAD-dependent epimerase/dehydratase family protein [Oscillospiraceae bacterium]